MAIDSNRMPPLSAVQSALYRITEALAGALAGCGCEPPAWSELEWRLAPAVAAIHGISSLLAGEPRWRGPPQWSRFLAEQRRHTLLRQQRIDELLARIDERARSAGIAMVALKGAALQAAGLYAAGERPMADVDLLVDPADLQGAVAVLLALSYHDAGTSWKHRAFDPPDAGQRTLLGEHADNPVKVDLHHRIIERLPITAIDLTAMIFPARVEPGLNAYGGPAALMAHLLAHTAGSMTFRAARLIQLCDISRLAGRMADADWEALLRWHGRDLRLWWAAPPLLLATRYFPGTAPREVLAQLERGCPRLLRRAARRRSLADFSCSRIYIDALPALIWSRSPAEALRYVGWRVFPGREQLASRRIWSSTGPWSAQPQWCGLSHGRRVLRWLLSRPTRAETLQPIRAALSRTC